MIHTILLHSYIIQAISNSGVLPFISEFVGSTRVLRTRVKTEESVLFSNARLKNRVFSPGDPETGWVRINTLG
jgi:hypothetical protein